MVLIDGVPIDYTWLPLEACLFVDEVAVFRYYVPSNSVLVPQVYDLLQPDEQNRARRFRREDDRLRFCYGRIMLKVLVAKYANQNPADIQLIAGMNNKPELKGISDLHVNIAHAGEWVLLAIGKKSVGVDVEKINPAFPFEEILSQSFSETEQQNIRVNTHPERRFYQLWTRKESLVKATAKGMDDDFSLVPSLEGKHYIDPVTIGSSTDWYVRSFSVSGDHVAAVAYQQIADTPKFYTLENGFFT